MPPTFINGGFFIIAIRAYRGHIVREWESVCVFVIGVRGHEPLNAGVLSGRGGGHFSFDASDLQMVLK